MRISDWSSDVCSSDLRDTELPLAKGLNVDRKATERAPIAAGIFEQSFVLGNPDVAPFTPHPPVEDDRCNLPAFACASSVTKKVARSEEHTSELQSLMRNSYAVFCLKKTTKQ